jgi:hypothetical protein
MITRKEVISRLCELTSKVGNQVFNNTVPHDCFCTEEKGFQFSEKVLEFIEDAVKKEINSCLK